MSAERRLPQRRDAASDKFCMSAKGRLRLARTAVLRKYAAAALTTAESSTLPNAV